MSFEERLEKAIPKLKAMDIKERSCENLSFNFLAHIEYHTNFSSLTKVFDSIKKHCSKNNISVYSFMKCQKKCLDTNNITNFRYRDYKKICDDITELYSKWYDKHPVDIIITKEANGKETIIKTIKAKVYIKAMDYFDGYYFSCMTDSFIEFRVKDFDEYDRIKFYVAIGDAVLETDLWIDIVSQSFTRVLDEHDIVTYGSYVPLDVAPLLPSLKFSINTDNGEDVQQFGFCYLSNIRRSFINPIVIKMT